jgi:hypothetical protein
MDDTSWFCIERPVDAVNPIQARPLSKSMNAAMLIGTVSTGTARLSTKTLSVPKPCF